MNVKDMQLCGVKGGGGETIGIREQSVLLKCYASKLIFPVWFVGLLTITHLYPACK
jgi:hypothetical protein